MSSSDCYFLVIQRQLTNKQVGQEVFSRKDLSGTIIESIPSLCRATVYIHTNPVHHNIANDFKNYKHSSFQSLLSDKETKLNRAEGTKMVRWKR
ncbi:MAG: hypothetical protein U5J96_08920 [Ignavibacteriaceae bacterium]|nr:hypothetical protein [Ignavibacteriaceae bacterium]